MSKHPNVETMGLTALAIEIDQRLKAAKQGSAMRIGEFVAVATQVRGEDGNLLKPNIQRMTLFESRAYLSGIRKQQDAS